MNITTQAFILTSESRDNQSGKLEILYYARSPQLGVIELVFTKIKALFFIPREAEIPEDFRVKYERKSVDLQSFDGRQVDALYFKSLKDFRDAADQCHFAKIETFEADVMPHERLMMEKLINAQCAVHGSVDDSGPYLRFNNPSLKPDEVNCALRVASIDIETGGPNFETLYSIAGHISGAGPERKVCFMLGEQEEQVPEENLFIYPTEQKVHEAFIKWFQKEDPDVIIGWYVVGYDLDFMKTICEDKFYMDLDLARNGGKTDIRKTPAGDFANITGRVVLEGMHAVRDAGYKFSNMKLDTVAEEMLGDRKTITATKAEKVAEIDRQFYHDKHSLARYNIQDCVLVSRIFEHANLTEMMASRIKISGLTMSNMGIPSAAFDHVYLPRLHRKGYVAPNTDLNASGGANKAQDSEGQRGVFDHVISIKAEGLLNTLFATFNIDPLARIKSDVNGRIVPGGSTFSTTEHILPDYFLEGTKKIREAKEHGVHYYAQAVDIVLKQLYQAITSPNCRLFNGDIEYSLKQALQWFIKCAQDFIQSKGESFLHGDDQNLYFVIRPDHIDDIESYGHTLANELVSHLEQRLKEEFQLSSHFELQYQSYFRRFIAPLSKKGDDFKFAGLERSNKTDDKEIISGIALSGNDWCEMAEDFLLDFLQAHFRQENIDAWLKEYTQRLKDGEFDEKLEFSKKLVKRAEEYSGTVPAQARAAQLLENPGKNINYVHTKRGPIPVELDHKDFDYQYYIDRQLAPIADSVLKTQGKDLKEVLNPKQLSLF